MALSSYGYVNRHSFVDTLSGELSTGGITFASGTDAYESCSLKFQGRFLVFGGHRQTRQISEIKGLLFLVI